MQDRAGVTGVPDMTRLSVKFSQALSRGRRANCSPDSRESLLAALLRKRAADELETLLRDQIRWALPIRNGAPPVLQAAEPTE